MKAVVIQTIDDTGVPELAEIPDPSPGKGEVLVRVRASALNRADLLQIRGLYPPPPGESEVPGLECAGEIEALGEDVPGAWKVGDRVMALLAGGGHGELAAVPAGQLMTVPVGLDFKAAAALPEAALTSWTNLVHEGDLRIGHSVLITAAASGVGTFAVQLARELGARVLVAGRSLERLEGLKDLGADVCLELGDGLPEAVRDATGGEGVDLVMDLVGGDAVDQHLRALKDRGCLVLVGIMAGTRAKIDLFELLRRRLRLQGSTLRARPRDEKAWIIENFTAFCEERLEDGRLRPVVDRVLPFSEVTEAYQQMEAGGLWGKLVLDMD